MRPNDAITASGSKTGELPEDKKLAYSSNWDNFVEDLKDFALVEGVWEFFESDHYTELRVMSRMVA